MTDILLRFIVRLEYYDISIYPYGPLFHRYLPTNNQNHPECKNGSLAFVVMNLKPVEIEHNYTEVGCMPEYKDWNGLGTNLK